MRPRYLASTPDQVKFVANREFVVSIRLTGERTKLWSTRIVVKHVDSPVAINRAFDPGPNLTAITKVNWRRRVDVVTNLTDQPYRLICRSLINVTSHDSCSFRSEQPRRHPPHATADTGDQHNFVLQSSTCHHDHFLPILYSSS